ncbi:MAG: segregation/condensation protein A [Acidimicrobiia bacterium]|nr:segregation/condensation protein A [Acidimicrobiia bacterium]
MGYEVRTGVFEGPFDLLLHLILRQELDLWDVSLASIVDEYVAEVERMERLDLDVATEFLLIAATLVELKARRLLPGPDEVELDEELLRFEERDLLLARLLECKTFKDAAGALERLARAAARSVPRRAGPEEPFRSLAPDPLERLGPADLRDAAARALVPRPEPVVATDHIAPIRLSVREAAEAVLALLPAASPVTFRELVAESGERLVVVVRFLAVLELYKQGLVDLEQPTTFGELVVRRLAEGETAGFDVGGLDDWGDEPAVEPADEPAEVR